MNNLEILHENDEVCIFISKRNINGKLTKYLISSSWRERPHVVERLAVHP